MFFLNVFVNFKSEGLSNLLIALWDYIISRMITNITKIIILNSPSFNFSFFILAFNFERDNICIIMLKLKLNSAILCVFDFPISKVSLFRVSIVGNK